MKWFFALVVFVAGFAPLALSAEEKREAECLVINYEPAAYADLERCFIPLKIGAYARRNISLSLVQIQGGTPEHAYVDNTKQRGRDGKMILGLSGSSILFDRTIRTGNDLIVWGGFFPPYALIVETRIKSLSDLAGATISLTGCGENAQAGLNTRMLREYLERDTSPEIRALASLTGCGVSPTKDSLTVEIIPRAPERVNAVAQGRSNGSILMPADYLSLLEKKEKNGDARFRILISAREFGARIPRFPFLYLAPRSVAVQHPQFLRDIREAVAEGQRFLSEKPKEATALIASLVSRREFLDAGGEREGIPSGRPPSFPDALWVRAEGIREALLTASFPQAQLPSLEEVEQAARFYAGERDITIPQDLWFR